MPFTRKRSIPFEIVVMHLEEVGGDHLRFALILRAAIAWHAETGVERGPYGNAEAVRASVGVALLDRNVVGRKAQFRGDDLGVGGLVTLPLRFCPRAARSPNRSDGHGSRQIEHGDAEDVLQFFDRPAPTISVKKATPIPMRSRVSPRELPGRLLLGAQLV